MGDEEHRSRVTLQNLFQPLDGLYVQMVRRLIQNQKLRLVEKDLLQPFLRLLPPGEDVVFPVILRHIRVLLRKVADLLSLCEGDHPAVRLLLPQDAAKKRRLSGSIDADNRGLLLLLQMEGNVPEHRLVQEGFI